MIPPSTMLTFTLPQKPTASPTISQSPTSCSSLRFYFKDGICNNEYQSKKPGNSGYDNLDHCCMMNDRGSLHDCKQRANDICKLEAISDEPTPSPTSCEKRRFYFHSGTCTNEGQHKNSQGYSTLALCCTLNGKLHPSIPSDTLDYSKKCDFINICNPRPLSKHFAV